MKSSLKEKIFLIAFAALVLLAVLNYDDIYGLVQVVLGSMNSLFIGAILAFVLNVPMKKIEHQIEKVPFLQKMKRPLALASVLIIFILVLTGIVVIILPTLTSTVTQIVSVANKAIPNLVSILQKNGILSSKLGTQINDYLSQFTGWSSLSTYATGFITGLVSNVSGIFSNALSWIMAFFFTLAILTSKEHLQAMSLQLLRAAFPDKVVRRVCYVGEVIIDTYDRFLMSQIVEAVIIGTLIFVSYSLFGMPYAALAGILTGILSFLPYIGPLSACIISALFISVQNPLLGLGSIVLFEVIQLIEGNVIYPRVVGQSVGLPTLFTLAAALIGGNLFGIVGMIFFTPIFAVIYRLVREWTYRRLKKKSISAIEE